MGRKIKEKYREKLERELASVEKRDRMLIKNRDTDREVMEEVFDKRTLMILYNLINDGVISEIVGVVKAGKESRLYWGKDSEEKDIAIKIYLTTSAEFRRGMLPYIEGDPRFRRIRRDTHHLVYAWAQKEFKNLKIAYEAGVRVPKPIAVKGNVLVMEFIGEDGVSAPLLKEVDLEDAEGIFKVLLDYVKKLYKSGLVHADLSEYNVMIWDCEPVLIDLSQSVLLEHPRSREYLLRDITNLVKFFKKRGLSLPEPEVIYREMVGSVE